MIKKIISQGVTVPEKSTNAFRLFGGEISNCHSFLLYMIAANRLNQSRQEEIYQEMVKILPDEPNDKLQQRVKTTIKENISKITDIMFYEQYFSQMAYARSVDSFITYLKDLLVEVVNKDPRTLKSKETETLEFILGFDDIKELRDSIVEKKIEALTHIDVPEINNFFDKKLGIPLLTNAENMATLTFAIKARNLIVHNRGRLNSGFKKEYPEFQGKIGDYLVFTYQGILNLNSGLNNCAVEIDEKVSECFKLQLIDYFPIS